MTVEREVLETDVLIVGAGPSGLSAAIKLAQLAQTVNIPIDITVIEKSAEIGGHILSGAVLEPRALDELFPNWQTLKAPLNTKVTKEKFYLLSQNHAFPLPHPPQMKNKGNYIISLGALCRWLHTQAEQLGVQVFPGFAGLKALFNEQGVVCGVQTGDMGINKQYQQKPHFQPGINIKAKYTLLSEGCRGSISQKIIQHFQLDQNTDPQTYGLGIKEVWEVPPTNHQAGLVLHTLGWPLDKHTYGGAFIYHMAPNLISLGLVVGLDYQNPYLSPFQELQRFKHHPKIKPMLMQGKRIHYGARSLNEGGYQSIPKLSFPGGLLIGCSAGFLNVPKIKGTHTAMKSGMLAAESVFNAFRQKNFQSELLEYQAAIQSSWIYDELYVARNIRPAFQHGLLPGMLYAGLDTMLLRGKTPWTFHHHADHTQLKPKDQVQAIQYPKPDHKISFDKPSSVHLTNTFHEEDQPCHLKLKDMAVAIDINLATYDAPEQYYCPAGVYEIIPSGNRAPYLQINAQNCIHCKTCDIKDPTQNIQWMPPEGGGGPNYMNM